MLNHSRRILLSAACTIGVALFGTTAQASTISWNPVSPIAGDSDVSTDGTAVYAYAFGNDGSIGGGQSVTPQTVNGVTFSPFASYNNSGTGAGTLTSQSSNDGNITLTTPNTGYLTGYGTTFATNMPNTSATFSSTYATLLSNWVYNSAGTSAATLNVTLNNLTPGATYNVQLWVDDSRNAGDVYNREETATAGNTSGTLYYNYTNAVENAGIQGGYGTYVIGTFVADSTDSETITLTPIGSSSYSTQIDALQLRQIIVPEPVSAAGIAGLLGVCALRRRRPRA